MADKSLITFDEKGHIQIAIYPEGNIEAEALIPAPMMSENERKSRIAKAIRA